LSSTPSGSPSSSQGPTASPEESIKTQSPPPSPTKKKRVAGEITRILTQRGFVDDAPAATGDDVYANGSVSTGDNGSLQFRLQDKIDVCTVVQGSRVDVQPSSDVLLHFSAGTTICKTTADPGVVRLEAEANVELSMSDPQFLVEVGPDVTIVRVLKGILTVGSSLSGASVVLGPRQRSDVPAGGDPSTPDIWGTGELKGSVLDAVNELRNLPDPDKSRPDPGNSPILRRIGDTGMINVGLDEVLMGDEFDRVNRFTTSFFSDQASHWNLDDAVEPMPVEAGIEALEGGTIDVFVASGPIEGLEQIPLFDDQQGKRYWIHTDPDDDIFAEAERSYLRLSVMDGSYRSQYLEAFGVEASYGAVASLFDLD
jgi:hypothetical protein